MGGCYLNDPAGHFLCFHPTSGQLHLPVGAERVVDDFQRGLGDEHVHLAVVGDRELRSVPHLVETREHKDYDIITRVKAAESGLEKLRDKAYHGVLRKSASGAYYLDQTSGGNSRGAVYRGTLSLRNSADGKAYDFNAEVLDRPAVKTPLALINTFKENPLGPGETIMHYLNRANKQELIFYYIDRFANGKRNYGYGKTLITEDMHEDKREELKKQKERVEADLAGIVAAEEALKARRREAQKSFNAKKATLTRAMQSAEADGTSCEPEEYAAQCQNVEEHKDEEIRLRVEREKEKTKFRKEASDLRNKRATKALKVKKKEKELEKLGAFEKYENETQASAVMTMVSMVFISLCQWILHSCFKEDKIGLETLIEKIFRLPGSYLDTSTERIISLHCQNKNRNKHEQRFNRMMERACVELSRRGITLRDGRLLRVVYVVPP
jgi:hypothetical protein